MSLGERLREARLKVGLTQAELGDLIGVKKQTITGYEKGDREPDAVKLNKLAQALGVTGNYLLEIEEATVSLHLVAYDRPISPEAREFTLKFEQLDDYAKRIVSGTIDMLLEQHIKP